MSLSDLATAAAAGLRSSFQATPTVIAAAPGRVNLIGEHIDYCDGFVLPFAIDRYLVIAAAPNGTDQIRAATALGEGAATLPLQEPQQPGDPPWANYLRGVVAGFQALGHSLPGFDAYITSEVPRGAGLSSSAAFECAAATLLEGLLGVTLGTRQKALLCQRAEHEFAGVPCGIMDQFASAFGERDRLILIDCQRGEPTLIPFAHPGLTVLIADTCVHHQLTDGGYAARRKNTEDGLAILDKRSWREVSLADVESKRDALGDPIYRRARHVVGEIARTRAAAEALARNDFEALGPLMAASHDSLRDDFEVSCRELDLMVDIARSLGRAGGVIGSRMTGGGFGGSTVTLCEADQAGAIAASLAEQYQAATGITPFLFPSRPVRGAHLLEAAETIRR